MLRYEKIIVSFEEKRTIITNDKNQRDLICNVYNHHSRSPPFETKSNNAYIQDLKTPLKTQLLKLLWDIREWDFIKYAFYFLIIRLDKEKNLFCIYLL